MTNNDLFPGLLPPSVDLSDNDWRCYLAAETRKKEIKRLRKEIKSFMRPISDTLAETKARCGVFPNGTLYLIRNEEKPTFDAKWFAAENQELYERYCVPKATSSVEVIEKGALPPQVDIQDDEPVDDYAGGDVDDYL